MATKTATNGKSTLDSAQIAEAAQEYLEAAAKAARERSDVVSKKAQEAAESGKDMIQEKHSDIENAVRRNPTLALAGALGVGLMVGYALKRRD